MEASKTNVLSTAKQSSRNSAVECLKIFAILLIVLSHVVQTLQTANGYVNYQDYVLPLGFATADPQVLILNILRQSGAFGNTIFVISSAWFLLDSRNASGKKITSMLVEIWIVSVLFLLSFFALYPESLDIQLVIQSLFPTTYSLNWYLTCYILLYMIHPALNRIIFEMNQKALLRSSLILSFLYILVNFIKRDSFQTSNLILWVTIYFCIAYMKLYLPDISTDTLRNFLFVLAGVGGNCILVMATNFGGCT